MDQQDIKIKIAKTETDFKEGKDLILEYVDWLGIDLSFQNFEAEINNLHKMYSKPDGGLLIATINNKNVGVTGIRRLEQDICELKRMYVNEAYRNMGIGKLILGCAIEYARKLKYKLIRLDTDASFKPAIKLYLEYGFQEIDAYRFNPFESVKYFQLKL